VFRIAPDGTETVLYAFQGGSDGDEPLAGLIMDGAGNLYGTTDMARRRMLSPRLRYRVPPRAGWHREHPPCLWGDNDG